MLIPYCGSKHVSEEKQTHCRANKIEEAVVESKSNWTGFFPITFPPNPTTPTSRAECRCTRHLTMEARFNISQTPCGELFESN